MKTLNFEQMEQVNGGGVAEKRTCLLANAAGFIGTTIGVVAGVVAGPIGWAVLAGAVLGYGSSLVGIAGC